MGGPILPFKSGRLDFEESYAPPEGRLPDADKSTLVKTNSHVRDIFGKMGFNDQEIVVLSGAHTLGRGHADASGYDGPWTPTPTTFNNLFYKLLLNGNWKKNIVKKSGNEQ
jgi:cytochrome c peroxidase